MLRAQHRVPQRGEHPDRVRVPAVHARLEEHGARDGRGDLLARGVARRAPDAHRDELGGALAVAHHELGELGHELDEDLLEGEEVCGGGRGRRVKGDGGGGGRGGGSVGEEGDHVVGAGVAFDGDAVVGFGGGGAQELLERGGLDGGVGAEDAERRRHVGVDHAGAFGDAGEGEGGVGEGGEGEGARGELGEGVGGADAVGGPEPVLVRVAGALVERGETVDDLVDGEAAGGAAA